MCSAALQHSLGCSAARDGRVSTPRKEEESQVPAAHRGSSPSEALNPWANKWTATSRCSLDKTQPDVSQNHPSCKQELQLPSKWDTAQAAFYKGTPPGRVRGAAEGSGCTTPPDLLLYWAFGLGLRGFCCRRAPLGMRRLERKRLSEAKGSPALSKPSQSFSSGHVFSEKPGNVYKLSTNTLRGRTFQPVAGSTARSPEGPRSPPNETFGCCPVPPEPYIFGASFSSPFFLRSGSGQVLRGAVPHLECWEHTKPSTATWGSWLKQQHFPWGNCPILRS